MSITYRFFGIFVLATAFVFSAGVASAQSGNDFCYNFTRDLTIGSEGSDVAALQNLLIQTGYSIPSGATGYFGTQTQAAVAAFQAAQGIGPTSGYFGATTRAKIADLYNCDGGSVQPAPTGCLFGMSYDPQTGLACRQVVTEKCRQGDQFNWQTGEACGIVVQPTAPLEITNTSMPYGAVGTPYSGGIVSTGGTGLRTWSIHSGSLPPGINYALGLCSSGPCNGDQAVLTLLGTPTTAGTYDFTASVTVGAQSVSKQLSIVVTPEVAVDPPPYTGSITATPASIANGDTVTLNWSSSATVGSCIVAGVYDGVTGVTYYENATSGVNKTHKPNKNITYTLECFKDGAQVVEKSVSVSVSGSTQAPVITTNSLPAGTVGAAYSSGLTVTGGTGTPSWSLYSGALPSGITLNSSTGVLSGTPTVAGTKTFIVRVTVGTQSVSRQLSIVVAQSTNTTPTGSIVTSNNNITAGGSVTVSWSSSNVQSCSVTALPNTTGFYFNALSGSNQIDRPTQTTTYTLQCFSEGARVLEKSVVVNVQQSTSAGSGLYNYNNDSKIDITDVQFLLDVAVGTKSCPSGKTCDINKDGKVSASDALNLNKYIGNYSFPGLYDYNDDHQIDATDAQFLLKVAVGSRVCPISRVCDLNGSNSVTALDALVLENYIGISGTVLGASTTANACYTFSKNLSVGLSGADVTALQKVLTLDGEDVEVTGYFGQMTSAAVKVFQQKYASEVLAPLGLSIGSGYVGETTRAKLNQLSGC